MSLIKSLEEKPINPFAHVVTRQAAYIRKLKIELNEYRIRYGEIDNQKEEANHVDITA